MEAINTKKRRLLITLAAALGAAALACALYLSIPTANITPADGATGITLGQSLRVDASPLASIGKVAVYADGEPVVLEYNLGTGELTRELDLEPGQEVRVETKVSSPIGLTREIVATFITINPLLVDDVEVAGASLAPGAAIPPLSDLEFHFSRPIASGSVVLDGGEAIELWIDEEDPGIAVLQAFFPLRQGATHSYLLRATAVDGAELEQELLIDTVEPLSLYGQVASAGAGLRLELFANVPFRDPASLRERIETDLPGARVDVEAQKIIITCAGADPLQSYFVTLESATGKNGSSLETPLRLNLDMRGGVTRSVGNTATTTEGYYAAAAGSGGARADTGGGLGDGPPPGWPPCCPWPPE